MNCSELLQHLKNDTRVLMNPQVEAAFRAVGRADFVPEELRDEAYEDYPLPIGFGQTISQPTTVAFMLEKLDVRPGQKVLDVGSGSGWTTALLANLVGEKDTPPHQPAAAAGWCGGKVIGVEIIPELVRLGQQNLARFHSHILPSSRIRRGGFTTGHSKNMRMKSEIVPTAEIRQAEKGVVGIPSEAPFDRILVSAASEKIPKDLIKQLKPNGVMVIPIGRDGEIQSLFKITKQKDGAIKTEEFPGFVFVPFVK